MDNGRSAGDMAVGPAIGWLLSVEAPAVMLWRRGWVASEWRQVQASPVGALLRWVVP
ncbi:MAG: hypothetical protein OXN80_05755 [bacterium]|nr:hypothetical protein [bacterium]